MIFFFFVEVLTVYHWVKEQIRVLLERERETKGKIHEVERDFTLSATHKTKKFNLQLNSI